MWIVDIAKNQNRDTFGWGVFAFFLPSVALIVIGLKKKIFKRFGIDKTLSSDENSSRLTEKALIYLEEQKYNESIRFAEKATELDRNNKAASDVLLKERLAIPLNEITNKHTQVVCRETKDQQILKIVSKNYQKIGASVFIDDLTAPDGEYFYRKNNRKLIVKDGKIEQMKD